MRRASQVSCNLREERQGLLRLFHIEPRYREAGVDDEIVTGRRPLDQRSTDTAGNAPHFHLDAVLAKQTNDAYRYR